MDESARHPGNSASFGESGSPPPTASSTTLPGSTGILHAPHPHSSSDLTDTIPHDPHPTVSWGEPSRATTTASGSVDRLLQAVAPNATTPAQPPLTVSTQQQPQQVISLNNAHSRNLSDDHSLAGASTFSSYLGAAPSPSTMNPSSGGFTTNNLTVNPVRKVNPLECEATSLILKALENQEAVNKNRSRADTGNASLLGTDVPPDAVKLFLADNASGGGSVKSNTTNPGVAVPSQAAAPAMKPPLAPNVIKKNQTTEQTLADLTVFLEAIHDTPTHQDHVTGAGNAGEAFVNNANLVFHGAHLLNKARRQSAVFPTTSMDHVSTPSALTPTEQVPSPPAASAAHNWSKLRQAVQTTNAISSHSSPMSNIQNDVEAGGPKLEVTTLPYEDVECTGVTSEDSKPSVSQHSGAASSKSSRKGGNAAGIMLGPKGAVQDLQLFVGQRRRMFLIYVNFLMFVVVPATAVSAFLFYVLDNPSTGKIDRDATKIYRATSGNAKWIKVDGTVLDESEASISWWILFICVRQALTFSLAHLWQVFIIDFLCLNTKFFQSILGNLLTLLIVQSKGWPFIAVTWGVLDFGLLHGTSRFASSWMYWQNLFDIFNEVNPSGLVTNNIWNTRVLLVAVSVGIVVSIKRLWLGLFLGKKTYANHADDLQKVYRKVVLLCEVATLARDLQQNPSFRRRPTSIFGMNEAEFDGMLRRTTETNDLSEQQNLEKAMEIGRSNSDSYQGNLNDSERRSMLEMLGAWEEPEAETEAEDNVSVSAILLFQNLVAIFDKPYMFSLSWGDVSTRDLMIDNSERVFQRLVLGSPDPNVLKFDVLARIAKSQNGMLDQDKLGDLIRLLRPNRDGNLNLLDFLKSVDSVYKEAKLLRASIRNSGKIDGAFEKTINFVFYTIVTCIILSQVGIDPYALFLSLSPLVLASAFMIGSAASKMFEGWLFILVRRPYNIGDRIHISNSEAETDSSGSSGWIVKDVTLFHTTAVFSSTGETATLSNGSLAGSRVINMARSPHASISVAFKFSTREPFEKIQIFDEVLREFIKERPREWSKFSGFRVSDVQSDLGFVEYTVLLTHREAWQNIGAILASKAAVASFCLELSKKLDMRYQCPPLPVDLAIVQRGNPGNIENTGSGEESAALKDLAALYDKNK